MTRNPVRKTNEVDAETTMSGQAAWPRLNLVHEPGQPAALKTVICEETIRLCVEDYGDVLRAIVLTGSLARDEGTFVKQGERWSLLGDAELLLIFDEHASLPPTLGLDLVCRKIESRLLRRRIAGHLTLTAVHAVYLRKLRPHIFAFELRTYGQVVWGEPTVLSLIPSFASSDIPWEDAWRLLCNRMIEHLEIVEELAGGFENLSQSARYRTVKLYLDMATSFLLFVGAYEPTYRERAEKLRILAENTHPDDDYPFPLQDFSKQVTACTQSKLLGITWCGVSPSVGQSGAELLFWEKAVAYARLLWRWELARLTGVRGQASDRELRRKWMQLQPPHFRLRGWAYVLRKRGGHHSWREWPRWGRRAWQASPRYWVYAAASELFFRLPCLLRPRNERPVTNVDWEAVRRWLPIVRESEQGQKLPDWWQLAADIVWNYHQFLVETRA